MSDYNPISIKYLTGWGELAETVVPDNVIAQASTDDIIKLLKKYSKKEREYFRDQWRKLYLFYSKALLEEEDQQLAADDEYLKRINKELDL